jgi:hypothetical protein
MEMVESSSSMDLATEMAELEMRGTRAVTVVADLADPEGFGCPNVR